jgi:hypothetical protein
MNQLLDFYELVQENVIVIIILSLLESLLMVGRKIWIGFSSHTTFIFGWREIFQLKKRLKAVTLPRARDSRYFLKILDGPKIPKSYVDTPSKTCVAHNS